MQQKCHVINPKVNKNLKTQGSKCIVNPYFGCTHRCLFCPANDGYLQRKVFESFRDTGNLYIVNNIVDHVREYMKSADEKFTVHLSPVADPFQPIEKRFKKTEEVINFCKENDIPMAICTKGLIPDHIYPLLQAHKKTFVQISMLTLDEKKRKYIVRGGGATVNEQLNQIKKLNANNIITIVRIDPIFPYINDNIEDFEGLVKAVKEYGVKYILSSCADIYFGVLEREKDYLNSYKSNLYDLYKELYTDNIQGRLHAKLEYREALFENLSNICKDNDMSFGITWEPDRNGNSLSSIYNHGAPTFLG